MNTVFLGLGSNIGQRETNIEQALDALNQHPHTEINSVSPLYETIAVSHFKQANYLNGAAKIQTLLTPDELLTFTESIETHLGRTSKGLGDPRTIDIDILFYNDTVISLDHLSIPHPLAHERLFVLNPLNDIAPDLIHPILNQSVSELRDQLRGY